MEAKSLRDPGIEPGFWECKWWILPLCFENSWYQTSSLVLGLVSVLLCVWGWGFSNALAVPRTLSLGSNVLETPWWNQTPAHRLFFVFAFRSVILTQIKIELKFILILSSVHHCMMFPLFPSLLFPFQGHRLWTIWSLLICVLRHQIKRFSEEYWE